MNNKAFRGVRFLPKLNNKFKSEPGASASKKKVVCVNTGEEFESFSSVAIRMDVNKSVVTKHITKESIPHIKGMVFKIKE